MSQNLKCHCIAVSHTQRLRLIKAMSAAIRWKANYPDNYHDDDNNLATIALLIEQLTRKEEDTNMED